MKTIYLSYYAAALFFWLADVLQKKGSENRSLWHYLSIRSIFTFSIATLFTLCLYGVGDFPHVVQLLAIAGCSLLCLGGLFFYLKAVHSTAFSNVGSLSIIGIVFQQLMGYWLFNESLRMNDWLAFLLMSAGCVYQLFSTRLQKGAVWVLCCSACWVSGYSLMAYFLKNMEVVWTISIMEGTILLVSTLIVFFSPITLRNTAARSLHFPTLIGVAILICLASYFNNTAFKHIPLSTLSILQLSMMPIGYVLSLRVFREKPGTIEWMSLVTGMIGFALFVFKPF
jgi:drug/metabolite transporter (DMT)-like permease